MFNQKIIFTNGCFDILHQGHVEYLSKAKDFGNKLIIGLNTDASVKRQNKSPERPINNEQSRAFILAALGIVDAVVLFDENTPYDLIKAVQPDVLVKGADYKAEEIVGYDIVKARGGEVVTIELTQGFSTTALINKIIAGK
ncbi:MAG TPA: D-glycero-beta-D-manno-heptose 1-phosphate adenylyltransferase [Bacteroidia bacterium]|nr:D-glycero-beta-D-manno-heptose 1-phosphate adenylyltransferase [Bacteroidia bacterium]